MSKIRISLSLFLVLSVFSLKAQIEPKNDKGQNNNRFSWDKVYFGGNLGLQFGNQTFIDVSPLVGYRLTEKLSLGLGATYNYYRFKDFRGSFSSNIYGGRVFGRYLITENIFAHSEYEVLNIGSPDLYSKRYEVTSWLVGGGYRQQLSERTSLVFMGLWNLMDSPYSPYQNPIIRMGVNVGF